MRKIFCIGELIIDFIGQPNQGMVRSKQFAKMAGGAPANVAAGVAKLGGNANFIGNIGADSFGTFLQGTMNDLNVDTSLCTISGQTTLAFVAIDQFGERGFEFYRGSDGDFNLNEIDFTSISDGIVHFGSATAFISYDLRNSYYKLLNYAFDNEQFISFDPNYRETLVPAEQLDEFIADCRHFIACSDLVKCSEVEAQLISGEDELDKACKFMHKLGAKTVVITMGARGCLLSNEDGPRYIPTRKIKQQVDSTGAGDAFVAALLFKISLHDEINWDAYAVFANFVGACTCCNYGAINAMPTMRQFLDFLG